MQKKKLVYIIPNLGVGGVEVALLSAIPELNRRFDFRVICLSSFSPNFLETLSDENCSNVITFKKFPINYTHALLCILKFKPDVVITSLWKATPLGIIAKLFRKQINYVEFIHSSVYFHFFDRIFTKLALKFSNSVFCDSISSKSFIERQGYRKPIEVISFLRFKSPKEWQPKEKISLKALYVGRFHECKRIDRLVLLIKKLVDSGLYFHLDLYGRNDGTMDLIKDLIKQNQLESNIFLKGEIASYKIQELFQDYDFYMQTSNVEGLAMSVVEAMQFGLVPIVTPAGDIKNYTEDMFNAIHIPFQTEHYDAFVRKIQMVLHDMTKFSEIAYNAYKTFLGHPEYKDSLVEEINKVF